MPAFSSSLSGFRFCRIEWPLDSCNLVPEVKSIALVAIAHAASLESSDLRNSFCEKSFSGQGFASTTGYEVEDIGSNLESSVSFNYGTNDRKRVYEVDRQLEASKRERGNGPERWNFRVVSSSRCCSPSLSASDVIGTIDFNQTGDFFATGGIARKIRICSYLKMTGEYEERFLGSSGENAGASMSDEEDEIHYRNIRRRRAGPLFRDHGYAAVREICTPGKLGSLKWAPDGSDTIGCGDYDGAVMEWSVEHGHTVSERYEHSGQRVWSFDYSKSRPNLSASSSADGTVRLWNRGLEKSVMVLQPDSGNSICSVEFSPLADSLIAVASADSNVYLYDLRNSKSPLLKLSGHSRAVSYVRFLSMSKLVSASTDSTLKLWDISAAAREFDRDSGGAYLERTFTSHLNTRFFVGLSVHKDAGFLACGSETNEVFLYRNSNSVPILNHRFPRVGYVNCDMAGSGNSYVGAVCWREHGDSYALVAANSDGVVQVLQATYL